MKKIKDSISLNNNKHNCRLFSCNQMSPDQSLIISFCLCVCLQDLVIKQILYICQLNSDLYETWNLSYWVPPDFHLSESSPLYHQCTTPWWGGFLNCHDHDISLHNELWSFWNLKFILMKLNWLIIQVVYFKWATLHAFKFGCALSIYLLNYLSFYET